VYDIEQLRHCGLLYDYSLFGKLSMTTPELRLATKGAATLRPGIAMKALVYQGLGKRGSEEKSLPMMQDPGDAIAQITPSKRDSKAWWALSSLVPLPGDSPSSKLHVMPVTSIGDVRHGRSTELQATMRAIEA
jgi:hypothetical protein